MIQTMSSSRWTTRSPKSNYPRTDHFCDPSRDIGERSAMSVPYKHFPAALLGSLAACALAMTNPSVASASRPVSVKSTLLDYGQVESNEPSRSVIVVAGQPIAAVDNSFKPGDL